MLRDATGGQGARLPPLERQGAPEQALLISDYLHVPKSPDPHNPTSEVPPYLRDQAHQDSHSSSTNLPHILVSKPI